MLICPHGCTKQHLSLTGFRLRVGGEARCGVRELVKTPPPLWAERGSGAEDINVDKFRCSEIYQQKLGESARRVNAGLSAQILR